jgi:hypothetical protein
MIYFSGKILERTNAFYTHIFLNTCVGADSKATKCFISGKILYGF